MLLSFAASSFVRVVFVPRYKIGYANTVSVRNIFATVSYASVDDSSKKTRFYVPKCSFLRPKVSKCGSKLFSRHDFEKDTLSGQPKRNKLQYVGQKWFLHALPGLFIRTKSFLVFVFRSRRLFVTSMQAYFLIQE